MRQVHHNSGVAKGAQGAQPPPNGRAKNKIDIRDFEVSRGLSSAKSADISTRLCLSVFELFATSYH